MKSKDFFGTGAMIAWVVGQRLKNISQKWRL